MPVILRKRLTCHYCGERLNATRKKINNNHKINCSVCLADNYFDAHNNIIDVPANEATEPSVTSTQPIEVESESDVFCKTCLTNQAFYVRALADYLPDEDDPRYDEFERALPEFEKDLDLRYPRCCASCEPRVNAQIQQANYAAKTDHLGRLMHRKYARHNHPATRLRSLFVTLAGLGSATSLLIQLLWHAFASQAVTNRVSTTVSSVNLLQCLRTWPLPVQCVNNAASLVPSSLLMGMLCIWWNPEWQRRLSGQEGRLRGLRTYYVAQLLTMAVRFTMWATIDDLPLLRPYTPIVHTLTMAVLTLSSIYAYFGIIKLDTAPLVDWSQVARPLVNPDQFRLPPDNALPPILPPASRFNINSLAGPSYPTYEHWQPPTPPGDDNMDWAPSQPSFDPRPRLPKPKFDQPSPFYGALPAAPVRGSLNPQRSALPPPKSALGIPPGYFGLSKSKDQPRPVPSAASTEPRFAPATFFAHERTADTGLENIFDKMFSVRDSHESPRPPKLSSGRHPSSSLGARSSLDAPISSAAVSTPSDFRLLRLVLCCTTIVGLAIIVASHCLINMAFPDAEREPSNIVVYLAAVPVLHVADQLLTQQPSLTSHVILPLIQALLALLANFIIPAPGSENVRIWNRLVTGFACFLLIQEIYHFCQLQSTPITLAAAEQMAQSVQNAQTNDQHPKLPRTPSVTTTDFPPPTLNDLFAPQPQPFQQQHHHHHHRSSQDTHPQQPRRSLFGQSPPHVQTSPIRKQASDESICSVSSTQTSSTVSGWKTPRNEGRTYDWRNEERPPRRQSSVARDLGGLSLGMDFGLGSGTGIAGPRTRSHAPQQGGGNDVGGSRRGW